MPVSQASISTDLTLPLIPSLLTWHDFAYATPPGAGTTICLELPVTIMWPPGFALAQNKLTTTVLHKMMPIALDGHNCGHMIPHVTIPPAPYDTSQVVAAEPGAGYHSSSSTTTKSEVGKPTTQEKSNLEGTRVLGDRWGPPL